MKKMTMSRGSRLFSKTREKTYLNQSTVRDLQLQFGSSCGLKLGLERAKSRDGILQRHGRSQHQSPEGERRKTTAEHKSPNLAKYTLRRHSMFVVQKPLSIKSMGFHISVKRYFSVDNIKYTPCPLSPDLWKPLDPPIVWWILFTLGLAHAQGYRQFA